MPWPVLLNVNQTVVKPFGQLIEIVEINNVGSNCWVTIDGNYVAGPYQQNVISLPAPESVATCELTSTAAPGQANPSNPQGVAILHFHPFAPGPLGVNAPLPNPGVIVGGSGWAAAADLNSLTAVAAGDPFKNSQVNQFKDLLTGVMTGQPVTLADGLTVDGGATLNGTSTIADLVATVLTGKTLHIDGNAFIEFASGANLKGLQLTGNSLGVLNAALNAYVATITESGAVIPNAQPRFQKNLSTNIAFSTGVQLLSGVIPQAGVWVLYGNAAIDSGASGASGDVIIGNTAGGVPNNAGRFELPGTEQISISVPCVSAFSAGQSYQLYAQATATCTALAIDREGFGFPATYIGGWLLSAT